MYKLLINKNRKKSIVSVLDIGSSKIACLIGQVKLNGKIKIIGIGHSESAGFKSGMITDRKLAENSIITAIDIAEKMCGENIDKVILSMSSSSMKSCNIQAKLTLPGNIITEKDVENLIKHSLGNFSSSQYEILHYFVKDFELDNESGIKDPVGLFGYELTVSLHILALPVSMVYNVVNCLAKCHLDIEEIVSSAYIAGFSCLTQDEKELGVILIDIGSTNTSYSIFFKNILIHSGVVPLGGMNVTSDIAKILSISMKNAERLKTLYGSSLVTFADNYKMIDVPLIGSESEEKEICSISNANLNNIIAARIEEIFNLIKFSINKASIDKALVDRIVLTGGGSLISGVKEFAGSSFNSKIRIAKPTILEGLSPEDDFTNFASAIGVFEQISSKYQEASESGLGGASRHQSVREVVTSWIKENF